MKLFFKALFLLPVIFFAGTTTVFAATTSALLPSTDGIYSQWSTSTGTTHYTLVDEISCNGTTDYTFTTGVGNRDSYSVSLSSVPDGATITQIAITPCASRNSNGGTNPVMNVFYRLNGVDSADSGSYSLSGTTPVSLASTAFAGLSTVKSPTTTLETGVVLTSSTKGARLSRIATIITYTPLTAPSGLTAVSSGSEINLSWADNATTESGYKIERSDNGGAFVEINTVGQNVTSYSDLSLSTGVYRYRVRAYNSGGNSTYSSTSSTEVIAAPTGLTTVASGSAIVLSWNDNTATESGYRIERSNNGGAFSEINTVGKNVKTYSDLSLSAGSYTYRVRAYNAGGTSAYTASVTSVVLDAPTGLTATVNVSDITLDWVDNSSNEDGFIIERKISSGSFTVINTVGPGINTYLDSGLSSGTYTYRVKAYKANDTSSYSASVSATVL